MSTLSLIIANLPLLGRVPLWNISGDYYHGFTLTRITEPVQNILYRISLSMDYMDSKPILVYTQNGWVLLVTLWDGTIMIISFLSPEALQQPTEDMTLLNIPEISLYSGGLNLHDVLESRNLPPFNANSEEQLRNIVINHLSLESTLTILTFVRIDQVSQIDTPVQEDRRQQSPINGNIIPSESVSADEISKLREFHLSYETLIKQLYSIPVQLPEYLIINALRANFVPFQQIAQMLSQNQIENFYLDPLLQPWAGPPNSINRILTMFGRNGITYLVKARYNHETNQVFSPV
jgi:hypothetical protein